MSIIRRIDTLFSRISRMSGHMQGQDVERHNLVEKRRAGGDYAAIAQARHSQGSSAIGFGR